MLLAIAASRNWSLRQVDAVTAFLNGDLKEKIYIEQPEGFEEGNAQENVCHLMKSLYGLVQSALAWYNKLEEALKSCGLKRLATHQAAFIRDDCRGKVIMAAHVNDMLLVAEKNDTAIEFVNELATHFELKDLCDLQWLLGMQIERVHAQGLIYLSQESMIRNMVDQYGF